MAPKRSAPPPPVESSEETASGTGTDDESEEDITHSPPSAVPKNKAPPPQRQEVHQAESSDEEEEDEKEEGEEEQEESESDKEEEAPQPKSALKRKGKGEGRRKPPPSSKDKKPFQRAWSKDDEIRILEALAAHHREHGKPPRPEELEAALAGKLDNRGHGLAELAVKLKSLKALYVRTSKKSGLPSDDIDRRIFDLSKEVWGGGLKPPTATVPTDFGEMCKIYPYLAEELKAVEAEHPGLLTREFGRIDNEKALKLDQKIKKQMVSQMKLELRGQEMIKLVTKTLMDLIE